MTHQTPPHWQQRAAIPAAYPYALAIALLACLTGCQTFMLPGITHPFSSPVASERLPGENIEGIRGPIQRNLQTSADHPSEQPHADDNFDEERLQRIYAEADELYKAGKFKAAEKKFLLASKGGLTWTDRITKIRLKDIFENKKDENDWRQYRGSRIKEDALFMVAEAQFAQDRFASAQDSYSKLIKDYPSTRHMDKATRRLFEIAQRWLGSPEFATTEEIYLADHAEEGEDAAPAAPSKPPGSMILVPNVTDRTRPVFDTPGRAIQALKTIWMNDPSGPLADDALMLTATYYLRKGNYLEADHFFGILREEFPKSPHLEEAFVLGSHVKLMSYAGPVYDGRSLNQARELKKRALMNFPDSRDADRLREELRVLAEADAERAWATAEYYHRRKNLRAVRIYCKQLLKEHPDSSFAEQAERLLAELGPEPVEGREINPAKSLEDEKKKLRNLIPSVPSMPSWFRRGDEAQPLTPEDEEIQQELENGPDGELDDRYDDERPPRTLDLAGEDSRFE